MAGLISFFGGRAMAWLVLGGGGLLALSMLWNSAKHKGALAEASKWQSAIFEKKKEDREANHSVNTGTILEQGTLQQQEEAIRQKYRTMGRVPGQESK